MSQHFLVSWDSLLEGRVWTLVTSVFSHYLFFHIFLNMYAFLGFGTVLERILGTKKFLKFYLAAGIFASFCHSFVSAWLLDKPEMPALGASGAVSAVIVMFSFIFPREKIFILGIIPVPALFGALLFIGLDIWGLISQTQGSELPIGHGAHLGGALYGLVYFLLFVRGRLRQVY